MTPELAGIAQDGKAIVEGEGPSVLRDSKDLHIHNAKFLAGSFAAVGEDQIIELYDGEGSESVDGSY